METWCELRLFGATGKLRACWTLSGEGSPDLGVVEGLAWLHLAARRRGDRVVLHAAHPDLLGLLDLAGLTREMGWQAEQRKDPLVVEEAVEPADPPG